MATDLALTTVVPCPTVREADGLAMSSRNVHLSPSERVAAAVLYRALEAGRAAHGAGERDAEAIRGTVRRVLAGEPLARVEYVSLADGRPSPSSTRRGPACLAGRPLRDPGLIDNVASAEPATPPRRTAGHRGNARVVVRVPGP